MPWVSGSHQKAWKWHRTEFSFQASEGDNPADGLVDAKTSKHSNAE